MPYYDLRINMKSTRLQHTVPCQSVFRTRIFVSFSSFESIRNWISQIQQHADVHVNKILVGNKCDMLDEKVVSTEEGEKLAKEFGIPFWECSAKNDINVDPAFIGIARAVKDRLVADGQGGPTQKQGLNLKAGQATQPKNKCCS